MPDPIKARDEAHFVSLVREGGAHAVPTGLPLHDRGATAWAGDLIRTIWYERRERIGNALLASGRLRFGAPVLGSNAVQIEVAERDRR